MSEMRQISSGSVHPVYAPDLFDQTNIWKSEIDLTAGQILWSSWTKLSTARSRIGVATWA